MRLRRLRSKRDRPSCRWRICAHGIKRNRDVSAGGVLEARDRMPPVAGWPVPGTPTRPRRRPASRYERRIDAAFAEEVHDRRRHPGTAGPHIAWLRATEAGELRPKSGARLGNANRVGEAIRCNFQQGRGNQVIGVHRTVQMAAAIKVVFHATVRSYGPGRVQSTGWPGWSRRTGSCGPPGSRPAETSSADRAPGIAGW